MDSTTTTTHKQPTRRSTTSSSVVVTTSKSNNNTTINQASAAAASLQLLLREDPLLEPLTTQSNTDQVAFTYAAALLQDDTNHNNNDNGGTTASSSAQQRANWALQDVERKLALVESLAVKLSRTSPEAVAGHLLRLHGYAAVAAGSNSSSSTAAATLSTTETTPPSGSTTTTAATTTTTTTTTVTASSSLQAIRDRTDRLERQSESLHAVARRVETSLTRGLTLMDAACVRLERVLTLSSTLKRMMRWQFEHSKWQTYDLDNVRDLTAAAASVAVLLSHDDNIINDNDNAGGNSATTDTGIHVLEQLRPHAAATALAVRQAAARLLQSANSLSELAATLQVYYHLGELPEAVWKAVQDAQRDALTVCRQLWNPVTLANVMELAKRNAKDHRDQLQKLRHVRAEAAHEWATGMEQACTQVRNLERVLRRKTDPVQRQVYMDVVAAARIPPEYAMLQGGTKQQQQPRTFSLFQLFWARLCQSLAETVESVLEYEHGKLVSEVAGLYPAVRSSSLDMVGRLQDLSLADATSTAGSLLLMLEDTAATSNTAAGILGGSMALEDRFLEWTTTTSSSASIGVDDNPQAADTWTRPKGYHLHYHAGAAQRRSTLTASSWAAVVSSSEWKELQGNRKNTSGLYPLEQAFLKSCRDRLQTPLQYMFPEHLPLDDDGGVTAGAGAPTTMMLPSKYDLQRFDENIRQELSLANSREGGGDLSAVPMIAACVVDMISDFCIHAKNAISGVGEQGYLETGGDCWAMTESLQHDRKVVIIMYTLTNYLRQAPEKTFVAPYRPSTLPQHEEAADLCQRALAPAIDAIDKMVKSVVLNPVCRALNRQLANVLAKMHMGVYLDGFSSGGDEDDSPAFVQKHLAPAFDLISKNFLARFPPPYSAIVASTVATYTIYAFVSNASLVRPLGESARLHITQDLADLELTLDQFVGGTLGQLEGGRPYAELRAVRCMLFWSGLEIQNKTASDVARAVLRETWIKDVRPSTIFHYLFSYAPSLLSSPHHTKRLKPEDYVRTFLVQLDGSVEAGEDDSWMTTMACCDAYQQRAAASRVTDGDPRVAEILMALGQELLRRRRL